MKADYTVLSIRTELKLVKNKEEFIFFDFLIPTVKYLDRSRFKVVWLYSGVLGPLSRGAHVMAPGIIKYLDKNPKFEKDEDLRVEIEGQGIFVIGLALMSYEEMIEKKEGPVIDILHLKGDSLDRGEYTLRVGC